MHKSITQERIIEAVEEDDLRGFCFSCGEEAHGVEPDAKNYVCEHCGVDEVFGADEALLELAC